MVAEETNTAKADAGQAWNEHRILTFNGQCATHIKTGEDYRTITLGEVFTMEPKHMSKNKAPAILPSSYASYDGRCHKVQRERGAFVALTGDIDEGGHDLEAVQDAVRAFAGECAWMIYSSANAMPGDMRWRIIIPLDRPAQFADWHDAQAAFVEHMAECGITLDEALMRPGQPVYLPNVPFTHKDGTTPLRSDNEARDPLYYQCASNGMEAPALWLGIGPVAEGMARIHDQREADEKLREELRKQAARWAAKRPASEGDSPIDCFNRGNSIASLLPGYGYLQSPRNPDDWRSPNQESGTYATRVIGDKWISLSASDAAAGLGASCPSGCYGDAFDLFAHYEHGGDKKAAIAAILGRRDEARDSGLADDNDDEESIAPGRNDRLDVSDIDLTRPPGLVGELAKWIEGNSLRPRPNLAVATALAGVGNTAGLFYQDNTGVRTNTIMFAIVGSGTGKENALQSLMEVYRASGLAAADYGGIVSEQEFFRNLIEHQAAFYTLDEVAGTLLKVQNAGKSGASYLENVIPTLNSIFTKANGYLPVTGDTKRRLRADYVRQMSQLNGKELDDAPSVEIDEEMARIQQRIDAIDDGIKNPFLSLMGFSEPEKFKGVVNRDLATNGFFRRAYIFKELDDAPRSKGDIQWTALPVHLSMRLSQLASFEDQARRIEYTGERKVIRDTPDATRLLRKIVDWFDDDAQDAVANGLQSLHLTAHEHVKRVSLILAVGEGQRTYEHVRWAYAMVCRDIATKTRMVIANDDDPAFKAEAIREAVMLMLDGRDGEKEGVIVQRLRRSHGLTREDALERLGKMVDAGRIERIERRHPINGKVSNFYRLSAR